MPGTFGKLETLKELDSKWTSMFASSGVNNAWLLT